MVGKDSKENCKTPLHWTKGQGPCLSKGIGWLCLPAPGVLEKPSRGYRHDTGDPQAQSEAEVFVILNACPDLFWCNTVHYYASDVFCPNLEQTNFLLGKEVLHRHIHVMYCKNGWQSFWNKCEKKQLTVKNWIANLVALQSYKYTNLIIHLLSDYIKVIHEDTENSSVSAGAKKDKLPRNSLLCLSLVLLKWQLTFISKML